MTNISTRIQNRETASTEGIELFEESDKWDGHCPLQVVDADISVPDWTPEEASKILGKSVRTIRRLLREGTLEGYKIPGTRRDEWRVKAVNESVIESVSVPVNSNSVRDENERLWQLLKDKDGKIEALVMRTGYLEALLSEREKELRLLTDSRDNRPWWQRFGQWVTFRK